MKPTLIKTCSNKRDWSDPKGKRVLLQYDDANKDKIFPDYCLVYEDSKYWIGIKPDFPSDGGSLPRWTWTITGLTPLDQRCIYGFFIHDGLYGSHLLLQKIADEILLNVMCIEPRSNLAQRQIVYRTLRCVGHIAYNDKSEADINVAKEFVTVIDKKQWGIA